MKYDNVDPEQLYKKIIENKILQFFRTQATIFGSKLSMIIFCSIIVSDCNPFRFETFYSNIAA